MIEPTPLLPSFPEIVLEAEGPCHQLRNKFETTFTFPKKTLGSIGILIIILN